MTAPTTDRPSAHRARVRPTGAPPADSSAVARRSPTTARTIPATAAIGTPSIARIETTSATRAGVFRTGARPPDGFVASSWWAS